MQTHPVTSVVPLFHSLLNHVDYVLSLIAGSNVKGSMGSAEALFGNAIELWAASILIIVNQPSKYSR